MIRSFRLRIALLVTAVAGVALVGFSGVAWRLIYAAKVSRVDARLEAQLGRLARASPPSESWQSRAALRQLRGDAEAVVQLLNAQGAVLYQSENWPSDFNTIPLSPAPRSLRPPRPRRDRIPHNQPNSRGDRPPLGRGRPNLRLRTVRIHSASWRIGAVHSPAGRVAIAVSLQTIAQEMVAIRNIFLVAVPGTLSLVALGAWGLSGGALRPIRRVTGAMQQITVAGLDQRLTVGSTDLEFAALFEVFNQMLERLERSFRQASRFSADAAHELKTPLAILQGELEQTLQQADPGSELQQHLSSLLDEVRRLSGIVRKLLLLSLADAGQMGLHKSQVDFSALLAVMVEDLELLAPHLTIHTSIAPNLQVCGDRDLLTQVLQNLIGNAIKYNLSQGWIRLEARQSAAVQVTVTNASREIPAGDRDRLFDRFYRGDPSRNRSVEGLGLGLSLAREIVHAHGGSLILAASQAGETTFVLTLPLPTKP